MPSPDPGSFRDPASRVIVDGDRVLRLLDDRGRRGWEALSATEFHARSVKSGDLITSSPVAVDPSLEAALALEHPRLPLITYPYEWTFSMLKDAAILHLELLEGALRAGLTMKDATPFNIQFVEGRPVFIDIGSFEAYQDGEPWLGYRQFTRQFLFPLLIRAWADLPFQPWLRGDMEGPTAVETRQILKGRKRFSPASLLHVRLQARLEERMAGATMRDDLKTAGFGSEMILANVAKLKKLISGLSWDPGEIGWSDYHSCDHVARDRDAKAEFLSGILSASNPAVVLDLGANDGHFSLIAAGQGAHAVAVDGDESVLERVYLSSRGTNMSIVVSDLSDPSPSQGWAGAERPGLFQRVRPDLVLALGLIHHLIYSASVPPRKVVEWLRGFDAPVLVEFVGPDDPMVGRLVANKNDSELHPGRSEFEFRELLGEHFDIRQETVLESPTRVLFYLAPR